MESFFYTIVTVLNFTRVCIGITPHWSKKGGCVGELGDIHDHSKCHLLENMNSGNVGRLFSYCITIVNIGLDIGFIKGYSFLMRQIVFDSSKKC